MVLKRTVRVVSVLTHKAVSGTLFLLTWWIPAAGEVITELVEADMGPHASRLIGLAGAMMTVIILLVLLAAYYAIAAHSPSFAYVALGFASVMYLAGAFFYDAFRRHFG